MRMVGTSIGVIKFHHNNKRQNHRIPSEVLLRCAYALWPCHSAKPTNQHMARNKIKLPFNSRHRESNCQPSYCGSYHQTKSLSLICSNIANKDSIYKAHQIHACLTVRWNLSVLTFDHEIFRLWGKMMIPSSPILSSILFPVVWPISLIRIINFSGIFENVGPIKTNNPFVHIALFSNACHIHASLKPNWWIWCGKFYWLLASRYTEPSMSIK